MRTRIKICGLKTIEQVEHAATLGVDAIGLVFHPRSPRHVILEQALQLRAATPAFMGIVALFMNAEASVVHEVTDKLQPDYLQFHGEETPEYCAAFKHAYIKAVPTNQLTHLAAYMQQYDEARGFLLDSNTTGEAGGSGKVFDWSLIDANQSHKIILAGGLKPSNVAQAIHKVNPWALDVSSGVEQSRGSKSLELMTEFVLAVQQANLTQRNT